MQRITRVAFAALLVFGSTIVANAQYSTSSKGERKIGDRPNAAAAEPQRLFVIVEANAGKQASDIQQIVRLGLEHLKKERKSDYDEIKVSPVSGTLYSGMKALFRGESDPSVLNEASIRLIPGGKSDWEVRTGGPFVRAKSMTVYFEKEEDDKIVTIAPPITSQTAPVAATEEAFRFHSPGTYIYHLTSELRPTRYEVEVILNVDGERKEDILKSEWPQENQYYLLVIDKFVGDRRMLFETLKNNRVVGNGLKEVQTVESATISLASFIDPIDTGTSCWEDESHYRIRVKKPDDKFPKRAWVLFPLDAETAKTEFSRLKTICNQGAEDRKLLLETIRSTAVLEDAPNLISFVASSPTTSESPTTPTTPTSPTTPSTSTSKSPSATPSLPTSASPPASNVQDATLSPSLSSFGISSLWYEIPQEGKSGSNLSRVFEIEPPTARLPSGEATFGIIIFEFNEEVILSVGNSYVQQIEHFQWPDGLNRLITAKAKRQQ